MKHNAARRYLPACKVARRWDDAHPKPRFRQVGKRWMMMVLTASFALAACTVYEEPLCGRAHPGGGVVVRVAELADDGGSE